jgi:hypothetical protein
MKKNVTIALNIFSTLLLVTLAVKYLNIIVIPSYILNGLIIITSILFFTSPFLIKKEPESKTQERNKQS